MSPTVQEPRITAAIRTAAMSKAPDTVSQFINGFNISDSFFEKDGFAVNSVKPVGTTGFSESTREETLFRIDTETKESTKRREEVKSRRRNDDIVTIYTHFLGGNLQIFANSKS